MYHRVLCSLRPLFLVAVTATLGLAVPDPAAAQRPTAPKLLPETTLAYLRVANSKDLVEKLQQTALGRIRQDEKIKPLVDQLYGSAVEAFGQVEEEVGVSLPELLNIPQGEVALALVAPEEGEPALVVLIDVGENVEPVNKLVQRGEKALIDEGATRSTETAGGVELITLTRPGEPEIVRFLKDGTLAISSNLSVAKDLLAGWNSDDNKKSKKDAGDDRTVDPLAENDKFAAILSRCRGSKEERPQITWFVDPIELARTATRGNLAAQASLALLPVLGLDGVQAAGGSVTLASDKFDMITHAHVLLDNPRSGVIKMIALESGDTTPERWVPDDAASYMTVYWDVDKTYSTLAKLYDSFRGEGGLSNVVKRRISNQIGADFEKEILPALAGRFTYIRWFEPPARIGSQSPLVAVKLKDAKAFAPTLDKIMGKYENVFTKRSFGAVTYYQVSRPSVDEPPTSAAAEPGAQPGEESIRERRRRGRRGQPCVAIVGDYLIGTDRTSFLEKIIMTKSDPSKSLANQLDYKLIASNIRRQVAGNRPAMVTFDRPELAMRTIYEIVLADDTRRRLSQGAENNQLFRVLNDALTENPLPPFAVIQKYLAPSGGVVTNDETGIHYIGFTLRRE